MQPGTRVLGVSESGYYEHRGRETSAREVRQTWRTRIELADAISEYLRIWHNRRRRHIQAECFRW